MREKLFSVTKKDFKIEYYKASGKGGQNRNKRDTAVRITHRDSGTVGNASEQRNRHQNQKMAFKRLVNNEKFKKWLRLEIVRKSQNIKEIEKQINDWVDTQMQDKYLKIETFDPDKN